MSRFRMYARTDRGGTYYWEEVGGGSQGSLKTKSRSEAARLLQAKNESVRQPNLNRELGRVYLKAADPLFATRTWQQVIDSYCTRTHLRESSRERPKRAFAGKHFDAIRDVILTETSTDILLSILEKSGNSSTIHYLRRLHNYALGLGWLPWQVVPPRAWPPQHAKRRRAITPVEHQQILTGESNAERRLYYELLWLTGASQSDAADLHAEQIDWENGILVFPRKKLRADDPPCILKIGNQMSALLRQLPSSGPLFPSIRPTQQKDRSAEFCRRCRILKIRGVSLHSYRYGWAERAEKAGMPERYAQAALGHASKAVHRAYARGAMVTVPPLEAYEDKARNIIPFAVGPQSAPTPETETRLDLRILVPALCRALGGSDAAEINTIMHAMLGDRPTARNSSVAV